MPMKTMFEIARTSSPEGTSPSVGRSSPGKSPSRRARPSPGRRSPPPSGCAPASACRCGRSCSSACSRPGWKRKACRGRSREYRRIRFRRRFSPAPAGARRISHLRVPSVETCSVDDLRPRQEKRSSSLSRIALLTLSMRRRIRAPGNRSSARAAPRASRISRSGRPSARMASPSSARVSPAREGKAMRSGGRFVAGGADIATSNCDRHYIMRGDAIIGILFPKPYDRKTLFRPPVFAATRPPARPVQGRSATGFRRWTDAFFIAN